MSRIPLAGRRKLASDWSETAQYIDPLMQGQGREQIHSLIAAVQARFAGHRFKLAGQPDGHGAYVRFSWTLAASGSAPVARGTDFVQLDPAGRVSEVVGFLDEAAV